ncbi:alpha-1,3-arabinosyltransferase XAT3-like [Bidens hawaiensis]|uniref:alpha-1,3-arabinosyltransferase XAT3-like n=1 Tax=Bidens hawaiensis TaxID=980011 RepID=UPI0040493446
MKYEEIFARSFSQPDQKRFKLGALVACFVVVWCMCTVFRPYLDTLTVYPEVEKTTIVCDTSKRRCDTCKIKGDVRIKGNSSTIFVFSSHITNASMTIKPYARKGDESAMKSVTSFTIKLIQEEPETMLTCTKTHNVPAIVFSVGGYAGNNFHAFSDIIIPLYAASHEFNGEVKFVVTNSRSSWTSKFRELLDKLSRYEIIDIDHENEVNCFPSVIVGLGKEDTKELYTESVKDFTMFLRSSYSLERSTAINLTNSLTKKPLLLIVSRSKTRAFTNIKEVVHAAQESGFEVVVTEMNMNLTRVSRLVNSCDVMMGVHGAGLTNMVFLPENSVLIQVVPWGKMDWLANTCFGEPSKAMGLKYLEYKISQGESTLIDQYPLNHQVLVDPFSIQRKGWGVYKSIYLDKQNVTLNITSFQETLSKALEHLH